MNVVLNLKRHVIIDDKLDLLHIKPSRSNICCDEHRALPPFFKLRKDHVSLRLRLVSMNPFHTVYVFLFNLFYKLVDPNFGLAEHYYSRIATLTLDLS